MQPRQHIPIFSPSIHDVLYWLQVGYPRFFSLAGLFCFSELSPYLGFLFLVGGYSGEISSGLVDFTSHRYNLAHSTSQFLHTPSRTHQHATDLYNAFRRIEPALFLLFSSQSTYPGTLDCHALYQNLDHIIPFNNLRMRLLRLSHLHSWLLAFTSWARGLGWIPFYLWVGCEGWDRLNAMH